MRSSDAIGGHEIRQASASCKSSIQPVGLPSDVTVNMLLRFHATSYCKVVVVVDQKCGGIEGT